MSPGPGAHDHPGADVPLFVEELRELPAEYPAELAGEERMGGGLP